MTGSLISSTFIYLVTINFTHDVGWSFHGWCWKFECSWKRVLFSYRCSLSVYLHSSSWLDHHNTRWEWSRGSLYRPMGDFSSLPSGIDSFPRSYVEENRGLILSLKSWIHRFEYRKLLTQLASQCFENFLFIYLFILKIGKSCCSLFLCMCLPIRC